MFVCVRKVFSVEVTAGLSCKDLSSKPSSELQCNGRVGWADGWMTVLSSVCVSSFRRIKVHQKKKVHPKFFVVNLPDIFFHGGLLFLKTHFRETHTRTWPMLTLTKKFGCLMTSLHISGSTCSCPGRLVCLTIRLRFGLVFVLSHNMPLRLVHFYMLSACPSIPVALSADDLSELASSFCPTGAHSGSCNCTNCLTKGKKPALKI